MAAPRPWNHDRVRRHLRAISLVALSGLVAVACSGGGGGAGDSANGKRATGKPLVVGMINMEDATTGSFPELRRDAEVAVRYVNEELDGAHNRPLRLEVCKTQGTPESSQACANQLRTKNPVAVLGGIDLGAAASLPVFERAKIPYLGLTPSLGEELTSSTAFMLAGGAAADLLGEAEYITGTLKAKKVGLLHLDLPGVLYTAILAARVVLERRGVEDLKIVSEKADAADFVPALRSVTAGNPDVVLAVFPAQGCTRILQAAQALRVRTKLFFPSACASQQVFEAAGSAANGAHFAAGLIPYTDTANPEVAIYRDQLAREGGGSPSLVSQAGFAVVMNLHRLLSGLEAKSLTPADLINRLKAARDEPGFMGHPYTCSGREVPLLPAMCNAHVRLLQYQGEGRFNDLTGDWVTGAGLIKLFTN